MGHSGLAVSTVRIIIKGGSHGNSLGIFVTSFPAVKHFTVKVDQWRFSESIPLKFEHKRRRHLQWFGKITNTAVLDKDENLLWSRLQWHWSCHSNEMTRPLPILLAVVFLGTGMCSFKIVQGRFFLQQPPRCSKSIRALSRYCGSEVFMNTNKLKLGQSWVWPLSVKKTKRFWNAISVS